LVKKDEIQKSETRTLIERMYSGSRKAFFAAFADEELSGEEIAALQELIEKKK
jgi:predicted transcriptional regulator